MITTTGGFLTLSARHSVKNPPVTMAIKAERENSARFVPVGFAAKVEIPDRLMIRYLGNR